MEKPLSKVRILFVEQRPLPLSRSPYLQAIGLFGSLCSAKPYP